MHSSRRHQTWSAGFIAWFVVCAAIALALIAAVIWAIITLVPAIAAWLERQ